MKKYFKFIFLTLFFSCVFVSVFAQKIHVGIQTGINSANHFPNVEYSKDVVRFNLGSVLTYQLTPKISFSLENGYSQQGNSWQEGKYETFTHLEYFRNAILLNYSFFKENVKIRPLIQTGFYYSFLLDMRSDGDYREGFFNSTDKGVVFKVGTRIKLSDKFYIAPVFIFEKGFDGIVNPLPNECLIAMPQNRTLSANISIMYKVPTRKN
ncbi:outer membrane beta-barrel protein [Bernardetia sp.]|uniref:outer membrane beta-barrel protein n=1 Tax=Bernardetia sp. TaxID=1937974 RepID=UPI0025BF2054|nr:outer membrane beta-barrel protein [Bernardetia sp.]